MGCCLATLETHWGVCGGGGNDRKNPGIQSSPVGTLAEGKSRL